MEDVNGQNPFESDTFIPKEILKLKEKFKIQNVLETGSQYGSTLEWFTENFEYALGCEPNLEFYKIAYVKPVYVYNIESLAFLSRFLSLKNSLIYIDSHWHDTPCPLKNELTMIAGINHRFDINPVICIHDFKVPNKDFGYDTYDYELCFEEIEEYLKLIYPKGFDYHYNEEADGARRGIIYIYPKS